MADDVDTAAPAAPLASPAPAAMLDPLFDGGDRPARDLAEKAGVAASTASAHLERLRAGGLVVVERRGRERRVRLAGPDVAHALEALSAIAPAKRSRSLGASDRAE